MLLMYSYMISSTNFHSYIKYGEVLISIEEISLLHTIHPIYPSTITSRVPSTSYEDGEAFAITIAHLELLFYLPGADYNLNSKLMLQYPYESLGVTYYQTLQVSFGHGILFGSRFKYEKHHSLSYQCILVILHGLRIHHAAVPELVEHIPLLPMKNIPPNILI